MTAAVSRSIAPNALGFAKPAAETRVVVAMSGGVDSSVVAARLAEQGFDVVGVTMQLYDHGVALQKKGACCAGADIWDARQVADRIGFPHYVLDYESRFGDAVMREFADAYLRGETPIPCIRCNQRVKFEDLLAFARDLEADCLATGHYVRRVAGPDGPELHRAVEAAKDQSYFLFATTPAQLAYVRFPLGGMTKAETRAEARRLGLVVADKPDSQDICFVPDGRYADVVRRLRPEADAPGEIVDLEGRVLGRHAGIVGFTIGQRRGLGIGGREGGLYVVAIDAARRRVVVGPKGALARDAIAVGELNWLGPDAGADGLRVAVKLRSAQPPAPATIFLGADRTDAELILDLPQPGVAPGQAAVFYDGDRVLGGGFIRRTARREAA
jgi:tRNA-specific 2-thiouridylase